MGLTAEELFNSQQWQETLQNVQNGSEAHPLSYSVVPGGSV